MSFLMRRETRDQMSTNVTDSLKKKLVLVLFFLDYFVFMYLRWNYSKNTVVYR